MEQETENLRGVPDATDSAAQARSWEELLPRHIAGLRRRVRQTLHRAGMPARAERVEELVQEVFCRFLSRGVARLESRGVQSEPVIACYLGRVAETVVLDQMRAARALKRGGRTRVERWPESELAERLVDPAASAEDALLRRECLEDFLARFRSRAAASPVGRREAHILELLLLRGCTLHEVSRHLGGALSPRRIASLLDRIRLRLELGRC